MKKAKLIPFETLHRKWSANPAYLAAYDALEEEFALVASVIEARTRSKLTQAELAKRMGTTQAVVARLESGRTMPSTRTLERFAKATGTKLSLRSSQWGGARQRGSKYPHPFGAPACRSGSALTNASCAMHLDMMRLIVGMPPTSILKIGNTAMMLARQMSAIVMVSP